MPDILKQLLGFIENKSVRLGVAAWVISTAVIAVAAALVGLTYNHGFDFEMSSQFKLAFVIAYIILFFAAWFIISLLNSDMGKDVYSEVRERIEGSWVVTYSETHGPVSTRPVMMRRTTKCTISINPEQKLEMGFSIEGHPLFKDNTRQGIKDVAIRYGENGDYVMMYYYTTKLQTKSDVSTYVLPEDGRPRTDEIELEVFGHVTFERPRGRDKVTQMSGNWFDLNGNISRIVALLDQKQVAEIRGEPFKPMKLSQVPIHDKYFDADMGSVEFSR